MGDTLGSAAGNLASASSSPAIAIRKIVAPPIEFFVVGPPRTATTWLHRELSPYCNLPVEKETHFFDEEFGRGLAWYFSQFKVSPRAMSGELCPTYFYSDIARRRIAELFPHARIICCFREPISRLYSLYKLKRADAYHEFSFRDAVEQDEEMLFSSRYGHYLESWMRDFGQERVLPLFTDDLQLDPLGYLQKVCRFVGIPEPAQVQASALHTSEGLALPRNYAVAHWLNRHRFKAVMRLAKKAGAKKLVAAGGHNGRPFEKLDQEYSEFLRKLLRPEIEHLERLTGRDLSLWKQKTATQLSAAATSPAQA